MDYLSYSAPCAIKHRKSKAFGIVHEAIYYAVKNGDFPIELLFSTGYILTSLFTVCGVELLIAGTGLEVAPIVCVSSGSLDELLPR